MACYKPISGRRCGDGRLRDPSQAHDLVGLVDLTVPCGTCIGCRLDNVRDWAIRITHEQQSMSEGNDYTGGDEWPSSFLTLTYRDEQLPHYGRLSVPHEGAASDFQLFAKRARKRYGRFRYFQSGEYGDDNGRPHHHCALFGLDFSDTRRKLRRNDRGEWLYTDAELTDCWGHGEVQIGALTFQSAAYVARYITKKIRGDMALDHYLQVDDDGEAMFDWETGECVTLPVERASMSNRPGLGRFYYERYKHEIYPRDEVIVNGRAQRPPRYYDKLWEDENPDSMREIRRRRAAANAARAGDQTPERLATRERVVTRNIAIRKRRGAV